MISFKCDLCKKEIYGNIHRYFHSPSVAKEATKGEQPQYYWSSGFDLCDECNEFLHKHMLARHSAYT